MANKKLYIPAEIVAKMAFYTEFAPGEVSGVGETVVTEEGDVIIKCISLHKQKCTGSHTDIDDESIAALIYEKQKSGADTAATNLWWHTHADFGVFWSNEDNDTMKVLSNGVSHLVSIVTNKAGHYKGKLTVVPQDTSGIGTVYNPVHYDLDVVPMLRKEFADEQQEFSKPIIDALLAESEEVTAAKEILKGLEDKMLETNKELKEIFATEDPKEYPELRAACEAEVKDKVRVDAPAPSKSVYPTHTAQGKLIGGTDYGRYHGRGGNFVGNQKKSSDEIAKEKRQTGIKAESKFNELLDHILEGTQFEDSDNFEEDNIPFNTISDEEWDDYNNTGNFPDAESAADFASFPCPECACPRMDCICDDREEKYPALVENFYKPRAKGIHEMSDLEYKRTEDGGCKLEWPLGGGKMEIGFETK